MCVYLSVCVIFRFTFGRYCSRFFGFVARRFVSEVEFILFGMKLGDFVCWRYCLMWIL